MQESPRLLHRIPLPCHHTPWPQLLWALHQYRAIILRDLTERTSRRTPISTSDLSKHLLRVCSNPLSLRALRPWPVGQHLSLYLTEEQNDIRPMLPLGLHATLCTQLLFISLPSSRLQLHHQLSPQPWSLLQQCQALLAHRPGQIELLPLVLLLEPTLPLPVPPSFSRRRCPRFHLLLPKKSDSHPAKKTRPQTFW